MKIKLILLLGLALSTPSYGQQAVHGSRIYDGYTGIAALNDGSTGTTLNFLAKYTTSGTVVLSATSDTKGVIGVVVAGAGTTGTAWIATNGTAVPCAFSTAITYLHYVISSVGTNGKCADTGSATYPSSGVQVLGKVISPTNGSAGTYLIDMTERQASTASSGGGATIPSVTNIIIGDGAGNGADSSVAIGNVAKLNATNTYASGGIIDGRGADHTLPFKTGLFSAIPGTCTVGEAYFATDKTPGRYDCTATNTFTLGGGATSNIRVVGVHFDGGGVALSGTITRCGKVKFSGTIVGASLSADQSGTVTVDVKTVADASYTGPASASSITASATPALASAVKLDNTTLTGWTTALAANTRVCFALSSPATITWLDAQIQIAVN